MKNKSKILVPMILVIALSLAGCENNSTKTSNQKPETISQVNTEDLLKYKDSYIGDNSAIGNIISNLAGNAYCAGFSLLTKQEPYGVTINYKENEKLGTDNYTNFWSSKKPNELLEKNAVILLALIKNADIIEFHVDILGDKSYIYNRKALEQKYGGDLRSLLKDETSFKNFINKD